jgi:tetratricopeptide (TPR) repeat protein
MSTDPAGRDVRPTRSAFWSELKRRRVYKVAVVYAAVAVAVWQVADILVPVLGLPDWVMLLVVVGPIVTFPFALVLAWAYDITPAGIRATGHAGAAAEHSAADGELPAGDEAATSSDDRIVVPFSSRALRRAAAGFVVISALMAGGWWAAAGRDRGSEPSLSEVSLAVFPFTVRGSDGLAYLREGVVDLLSRNLSGETGLQPLDPSLMLTITGGLEPGDPHAAGAIARRVGAGRFLTGTVNGTGARVRIDASLFSVRDSVHHIASRTVQGDTTQIFELIDQLTAGLLSEMTTGAASERMVRTAVTTTSSLPALKAYLEGEQRYRQGEHEDAADSFQRALEADSTFALARYRLAMTYHMRGESEAAYREVDAALRHADRLTAHDQRVMRAFHAFHGGAIAAAEQQLRAITREYPRDLEARVILAELLMMYAPYRAQPLSEARRLLEEVLEADPKFMCIYCQLAAVLNDEGDPDGAARLMRQLHGRRGGDTTTMALMPRFYYAALRGDSAGMWRAIADLDTVADDRYPHVAFHMGDDAISLGRFREAEAVIAAVASRPQARRQREELGASLAFARGRWDGAREHLALLGRLPDRPPVDRQAAAHLFFAPFEAPPGTLDELRGRLLTWSDGPITASLLSGDWTEPLRPAARHYLLGLIAARSDDARGARIHADSLVRLAAALPAEAGLIDGLARVVRADLAVRTGDPRGALRELDGVSLDIPPSRLRPWISGHWHAGHVRIRAHLAMGEPENAYRWLRHFAGVYRLPLAGEYGTYHRDMAAVLDALGRREEAALHYARFVEAWADADAALQPQVEAAARRLQLLIGEGRAR